MLIESRKIVFPPDVLGKILIDFCHDQGVIIPNSQLQHVKVDSTDKVRVILQFATATPERPAEVPLNEVFVLSAMISACKRYQVPIPRAADKTLQKTDQGLAMHMAMKTLAPD